MSSDSFSAPLSSSDLLRPVPAATKKLTPEDFLGANAKLVDFDDLVAKPTPQSRQIILFSLWDHFAAVNKCF